MIGASPLGVPVMISIVLLETSPRILQNLS